MDAFDCSTASLPELVGAYRENAERHGDATESGNHRTANLAAEQINTIYSEIRRRGLEAQRLLIPLLSDGSPGVRLWSASHALEIDASSAEAALEGLAQGGRLIGLSAETTLKECAPGVFSFLSCLQPAR